MNRYGKHDVRMYVFAIFTASKRGPEIGVAAALKRCAKVVKMSLGAIGSQKSSVMCQLSYPP